MNILVVGGGSWDDTTSLGNTLSNLFAGWENAKFYNLYFRETMPNNSVCKYYFRITTKELLKKFFSPSKIGAEFHMTTPQPKVRDTNGAKEKKAISIIHRYGLKSVYELEDWLWYFQNWKNQSFDQFLEHVNPDVIFSFAAGNSYMVLPAEYIKNKTNAKLVLLVADDMHTTYRLAQDRHHMRMRKDFDRLMALADKVYGISEEMCQYYSKLYGINVEPLYKGCAFENQPRNTVNKPIKLAYAGNLLFGRIDTLIALSKCLQELSTVGICASLDIYSGTIITEEQRKQLNRGKFSCFHGEISYSEVKQIMSEADIVLHVESFNEEQIKSVRYSFSTKIIDCLQSGSVLLAIGPRGISSIEYPKRIPGAVVIDNIEDLYNVLYSLLSEGDALVYRAQEIRRYAIEKHSIERVRKNMQSAFERIIT